MAVECPVQHPRVYYSFKLEKPVSGKDIIESVKELCGDNYTFDCSYEEGKTLFHVGCVTSEGDDNVHVAVMSGCDFKEYFEPGGTYWSIHIYMGLPRVRDIGLFGDASFVASLGKLCNELKERLKAIGEENERQREAAHKEKQKA